MSEISEFIATQTELNKQNAALMQALAADKIRSHGWEEKSMLYHTKDAASVQTATPLHGTGGIFSTPGLDRTVITAHVRPRGIASAIPAYPSIDEKPVYGILTGYSATVGEEPENACEDAPAGYMKSCVLTNRFGLARRDTQTIDFDKVANRINRGDFTDLRLVGQVLGLSGVNPRGLNQDQILSLITKSEMVGAAVQAERKLVKDFWQGTILTTGSNGLDVQINTGIVDAETGVPCPAVDSDVKDFTYNNIDGSDGKSIVEYITMLEYYIFHNAERMGLTPFTGAWVMRPEMWAELSAIWPCQYNTNRCATAVIGEQSSVVIDGRENMREVNAMRNSMTLAVNGRTYPVIIDDGIVEEGGSTPGLAPGEYASSIYFVPLTVNGGFQVLYREYNDYNSDISNANVALLRGRNSFWTDGGMYAWAYEENKFCYKLALKTEQRIILRTPQLAGRIQNVKYVPLQHLRSPFSESPYFFDGGVSYRP